MGALIKSEKIVTTFFYFVQNYLNNVNNTMGVSTE